MSLSDFYVVKTVASCRSSLSSLLDVMAVLWMTFVHLFGGISCVICVISVL